MSARTKIGVVCVLIILGAVVWFLALPSLRFATAQKKFPLGMRLEQARQIATPPVEVLSGGPVFPDGDPTGRGKQTYSFYTIYARNDGVLLGFNYYSNLITVIPLDSPIDSWKWKRARK
jgi:hypothetical protein